MQICHRATTLRISKWHVDSHRHVSRCDTVSRDVLSRKIILRMVRSAPVSGTAAHEFYRKLATISRARSSGYFYAFPSFAHPPRRIHPPPLDSAPFCVSFFAVHDIFHQVNSPAPVLEFLRRR